jgi:hypothetical protein
MKKALVGFLILAVSAGIFAQEEKEQGLKLGGALKTGIQFKTSNEKDTTTPGGNEYSKYDPSIRMYNDDADAETRLDLEGAFTKDNYGVVFRLRTDTVISGPEVEVHQAYVWGDFLNQIINLKVGLIDDSAWNTDGDEDFHYSTGAGLRLEVKPIEGLNVGLFLNGPGDYISTVVHNGKADKNAREALEDFIFAKEFLLETSFGAKYENDAFYVAGGLRLDGKGDGLDQLEVFDWETNGAGGPIVPGEQVTVEDINGTNRIIETVSDMGSGHDDSDKGLGAYVGFGISAVPNLTAKVEAQFSNLMGYAEYGWIWVNETLGYAVTEQLEVSLVMHQYLFGEDNKFTGSNDSVSPYFTFEPEVSYGLTDKWTVGVAVPVGFWSGIIDYDLGVKPKVSYNLGDNASINAFYLFDYLKEKDVADAGITNTVQIDFIWTF